MYYGGPNQIADELRELADWVIVAQDIKVMDHKKITIDDVDPELLKAAANFCEYTGG